MGHSALCKELAGDFDCGLSWCDLVGLVPKSAVVGFRISPSPWQHVGWIECNETQQSLD
jgi:hypothetical protein